jgi:hypothetical protein
MGELPSIKLLIDGEAIPVTNLFDEIGDDVTAWADAHTFVAGPLPDGTWMAAECADYREAKLT